MKTSWKKRLAAFWRGWGCPVIIALVIATSFKSAIADWNVVPTGSMKPTIVEGDRIFVNKLAYDLKVPYTTWHIAQWDDPRRGEIVVFFSPEDGKRLVKRVVGLPGDTIAMQNNRLYLNDSILPYRMMDDASGCSSKAEPDAGRSCFTEILDGREHSVMISTRRSPISSFLPVTVPAGKYFLMGDNRDNSADSRYFGSVDRRQIVGRAPSIVASFDLNNHYRPRWDRFFTRMQ